MYRKLLALLLLPSLLILSSCVLSCTPPSDVPTLSSDSEDATQNAVTYNEYYNETYFDVQGSAMPTEDDINQVIQMLESGRVPMKTLIEILGKPHNVGPTSGFLTWEWKMADDRVCLVYIGMPSDMPEEETGESSYYALLMEYGYAFDISVRVRP